MRIPHFVLLLLLKQALWSQQEELPVKDTIPSIQEVDLKIKDTLKKIIQLLAITLTKV